MRYVVLFSFLMLTFAFGNPVAAMQENPIIPPQLAARVAKSYSVACDNVAVNVANQILGGFDIEVTGEAIMIPKIAIVVLFANNGSGIIPTITTASIVDSHGKVVAGPVDMRFIEGSYYLLFTESATFPPGKGTYRVTGTIGSTAQKGTQITLSTTPSGQWTDACQVSSGKRIQLNSDTVNSNTMTVQKGALKISVFLHPPDMHVPPGTNNHIFTIYTLDATESAEDVQLSCLPLLLTTEGKAGGNPRELTNMQLWDGEICLTTGQNVVNPDYVKEAITQEHLFTFDQRLVIPKGTAKQLLLRGNISSSSPMGSSFCWGLNASSNIAVTGLQSGSDIQETVEGSKGQMQVVGIPEISGPPAPPTMPSPMSSPMPSVPFGCNPGDAPVLVYSTAGPPDFSSEVSNSQGIEWLLSEELRIMGELKQQIANDDRTQETRDRIQKHWNSLCNLRNVVNDKICATITDNKGLPAEIIHRWYRIYIMRPSFDTTIERWMRSNVSTNKKG